jgi:heme exporter protein B
VSSSSGKEILAVLRKEARLELRSQAGLMTAGLFCLVTVVSLAVASYGLTLSGTLDAGMLWIALMFSACLALPRTFVQEEELGTSDLLRQWAHPHAIYWGKAIFNAALMSVQGVLIGLLYVFFTSIQNPRLLLLVVSTTVGAIALASAVTLCGAVVAKASNRTALAAAIAVPLLFPLATLGVNAMAAAFDGPLGKSWLFTGALAGYAATLFAIGPYLYAAVWKS